MNFIQNVSWKDIESGNHMDASVLIQITDPACEAPVPKVAFSEVHHFEFLDIDDSSVNKSEWGFRMTQAQAKEIVSILRSALDERRNVVVHCHAGICRSGAVAEVGEMMGFAPGGTMRLPNTWVKGLLMKNLGWSYA